MVSVAQLRLIMHVNSYCDEEKQLHALLNDLIFMRDL